MADQFIDVIRERVGSICEGMQLSPSATPFSFDLQPSGAMDQAYRIESEQGLIVGGFNYTEERTDLLRIWVARKQGGQPQQAYASLLVDVSSLRAAVIRDGLVNGGDFGVPDQGSAWAISHDPGREYAVLRLTVPVNYETSV